MDQCPHCGSSVTGGPKCSNCGQSLDALPEYHSETTADRAVPPDQIDEPPQTGAPTESEQPEADGTLEGDAADGETANGPIGGRLSRRALLGGAGASVALLGVGGAGWTYLQNGGRGNRVIRSYVDAIAANNWSQAADLYHEEAPVFTRIQNTEGVEGYEGYLESREVLEMWEDLDPELDGIQDFTHATEVTEESVEDLRIQLSSQKVDIVDEFRSAIAFLTIEVGALNEDREDASEYYEDGSKNRPLTCDLVLADGEWSLWTVRGVGRY